MFDFATIAGLLGGLGLFLLGLRELTDGLKGLAGDRLAAVLRRLTTNRFTAVLTGVGVTAVVQSSSITTVLAVGFVSAGAMTFAQSVGVVLGANVGTTITAQAVAFDIESWAFALVAAGSLGLVLGRADRFTLRAGTVLGLGLVFVGMQVMAEAVEPLRDDERFLDLMARFTNPLLGVLAGAVVTALLQSSSATTAMTIALAGQGLVGLDAGAAIIVGANVGTCVTAALAAIGKPPAARRVAAFHVLVNLIGAAVWVGMLDLLVDLAEAVTAGGGAGPGDARQLANIHTIFNLSVLLLLFPFAGGLAALVERRVGRDDGSRVSRLDEDLLGAPALALEVVRLELGEMCDSVALMLEGARYTVHHGTGAELSALAAADDEIDRRYRAVLAYVGDLGRSPLSDADVEDLISLVGAADAIESIGDVIETNLVGIGRRRLHQGVVLEPGRLGELADIHRMVLGALRDAGSAFVAGDEEASREVLTRKAALNRRIAEANAAAVRRLATAEAGVLRAHAVEVEEIEALRRIHYHTRRLARAGAGEASPRTDPGS